MLGARLGETLYVAGVQKLKDGKPVEAPKLAGLFTTERSGVKLVRAIGTRLGLVEGRDFEPVVLELSVGGDLQFTVRVEKALGFDTKTDLQWFDRIK